jgi:REP element-mobilizing transposase RayT
MKFDADFHHRRSIRLRDYDYAQGGAYFVTVCVQGRELLLGAVEDGTMVPNEAGKMIENVWYELPGRCPNVRLDEFVIMPNHVHGIIWIVGAGLALPGTKPRAVGAGLALPKGQGAASSAPTLGDIVRVFKSISAIAVNRLLDRTGSPLWQRNYYERIVRDEDELAGIRTYIRDNPGRWGEDAENPAKLP